MPLRVTTISALFTSPLPGPRFSGIKLTKTGGCYQGVYTPDGDSLTLNGDAKGCLTDSGKSFQRFLEYKHQDAKADSTQSKLLQHRMRRHIQHRLNEGLLNGNAQNHYSIPAFLACVAMFKEYAGYIQGIQVSPDKSKVTFRVGYPNASNRFSSET